ncbi:hypothetical protein KJ596_01865 [Patescibacteria group bacterium]|nr:hypothetical protein [Patescibacteria group bacterium]MBU1868212.1 hypothetical protein [Patescibacteria group bacterium]
MESNLWEKVESEHSIYYFFPSSYAHKICDRLVKEREAAYEKLNSIFKVVLSEKIKWYFFPSREEGVRLLGTLSPEQAIAPALVIFTVYNEHHDSTPEHELVHILSFYWNSGLTHSYKFLSEGLAGYLDSSVKGKHELARKLKVDGKLISFKKIITSTDFKSNDPDITYIQSASFVRFVIEEYGWSKFSKLWLVKGNLGSEMGKIYGLDLEDIEREWLNFLED